MKKLIIYLFLLLTLNVSGQILPGVIASGYTVSTGTYCSEYQTVYDAMTTKPTTAHADAQNAFVVAAKTHGYWTIFNVFYFYAQDTNGAGEALLNWISIGTNNSTLVNSPTFTALQGFLGNGSGSNNAWINTNFNASTEGVTYTLNSASYGGYQRINISENKYLMGATDGTYISSFITNNAGVAAGSVNSSSSSTRTHSLSSQGLFMLVRDGAASVKYIRNGVQFGTTSTTASSAIQNADFLVLSYGSGSSNNEVSMAFAGGAMTQTQYEYFNSDFETLMDAIGTGVE